MTSAVHPHREGRHPTPWQYVIVATFLFIITAIEVVIIYIDALDDVVVPMLILLSAVKFGAVVMFYMHLKFDSRLFTWIFIGGLALALTAGTGLLALFGALHSEPRAFAEEHAVPYEEHGENERVPLATTVPAEVCAEAGTDTASPVNGFEVLRVCAVGETLEFDKTRLTAKAGSSVVVVKFKNASGSQQHNWVLVQSGTKDAVAAAGLNFPNKEWIPQGDPNVMANTRLLHPGEMGDVTFTAPPAGTYQFLCTFPGHNAAGMSGDFVVQ